MIADLLNMICAVGLENRAKINPVASANPNNPNKDSTVIKTFEAKCTGAIFPYPIVAKVSTLKKKARANPLPRFRFAEFSKALGPHSRYPNAKITLAKI